MGRAAAALCLPPPPRAFQWMKGPQTAGRNQKPDTTVFVSVSALGLRPGPEESGFRAPLS